MKLIISQLKEGDNAFHFVSDRDSWMKDVKAHIESRGYQFDSSLEVELSLTKLEPDYYLRGQLRSRVQQTCARCAESFPLSLASPFEVAFAHVSSDRRGAKTAQMADESEEFDVNFFEGNEIDLSPVVEEQFFLSLPYQALCKSDCKGICQQCGKNLNQSACPCKLTERVTPFSALQKYKL